MGVEHKGGCPELGGETQEEAPCTFVQTCGKQFQGPQLKDAVRVGEGTLPTRNGEVGAGKGTRALSPLCLMLLSGGGRRVSPKDTHSGQTSTESAIHLRNSLPQHVGSQRASSRSSLPGGGGGSAACFPTVAKGRPLARLCPLQAVPGVLQPCPLGSLAIQCSALSWCAAREHCGRGADTL